MLRRAPWLAPMDRVSRVATARLWPPAMLHTPAPDDGLAERVGGALMDHLHAAAAGLLTPEAQQRDLDTRLASTTKPQPYTSAELRRHREELACL